tara:strand:- start:321 stop:1088 length:768 start_codon:yes stop_codon:yes gene_type:complete
MTRHTAYDRIGTLLTEEGYESVTEYLMEGNSSELLTEEQLSALLAEHYEEELIESLSEEDRLLLVEALITELSVLNRARAKVVGGALKRGASKLANVGPTWGQVGDKLKTGAGHVANVATAGQFQKGSLINRGIDKWKGAVKKEVGKERRAATATLDQATPVSTKTGSKVSDAGVRGSSAQDRSAELPSGGIGAVKRAKATLDQHALPPEHGGAPARAKRKKLGAFGKALRGISNAPKKAAPPTTDDDPSNAAGS